MPYEHFVNDFIPSAVHRRQLIRLVNTSKRPLRGNCVEVYIDGFPRAQETFMSLISKSLSGSFYTSDGCICFNNLIFKPCGSGGNVVDDNFRIAVSTTGIQRIIHRRGKTFVAESFPEEDDFIVEFFLRFLMQVDT